MGKQANVFESLLNKLGNIDLNQDHYDTIERMITANRSVKDIVKAIKAAK